MMPPLFCKCGRIAPLFTTCRHEPRVRPEVKRELALVPPAKPEPEAPQTLEDRIRSWSGR